MTLALFRLYEKVAPTREYTNNEQPLIQYETMNEEQMQAAREAFKRDKETACQAMLGCSSEELFVQALKGCNQYGHKPGCQHRKKFREDAYAEYAKKLKELQDKYGSRLGGKKILEEKIAELDEELLAKLKSKNADA